MWHIVRRYNTMASLSFSQEDSQLIAELHSLHKRSSKLVNSKYDRPVPTDADVTSGKPEDEQNQ